MSTLASVPLTTLSGAPTSLADYAGKVLLIVNVASKCGLTPQYTALEALYQQFKDRGFFVLGFPSNDFASQEPGTAQEITEFCTKNYGVTFPMAEKSDVVGDNISPLFKYLTDQAHALGVADPVVKWNFTKFLVDENGKLIAVFPSKVKPMDAEITKYLN